MNPEDQAIGGILEMIAPFLAPIIGVPAVLLIAVAKAVPTVIKVVEATLADKPGKERLAEAVRAIEDDHLKIKAAIPGVTAIANAGIKVGLVAVRPLTKAIINSGVRKLPITRNRAGAEIK